MQQRYHLAKQSLSHASLGVCSTGCIGEEKNLYSRRRMTINRAKVLAEYLVLWRLSG